MAARTTRCRGVVRPYRAWKGGLIGGYYYPGPEVLVSLCRRHYVERKAHIEEAGRAEDDTTQEFLLRDLQTEDGALGPCDGPGYALPEPAAIGPPFTILGDPIVLTDEDFERVVEADREEPLVCIPRGIPDGMEAGVFAYVKGVSRTLTRIRGRPYRILATVREMSAMDEAATGEETAIVTLGRFRFFPARVKLPATLRGPFPWAPSPRPRPPGRARGARRRRRPSSGRTPPPPARSAR